MFRERVLERPAAVMSEAQRASFVEKGYVVLPGFVGNSWLARLRSATQDLMDRSRTAAQSDEAFVLEAGHSAEQPRLHRVNSPQDHHPTFWEFFRDPGLTEMVADLVGPDIKFHHAKLNIKAGNGTQSFKWHQDIPGWPHTDFSPVTVGVYLENSGPEQGPLAFVPGSHRGPLHPSYDEEGYFVGVPDEIVTPEDTELAVGEAGSVVVLDCRVIHGSGTNQSDRPRPLLLPVYSSADSFPYTSCPIPSPRCGEIVRGERARFASFDPSPCPVPPETRRSPWSKDVPQAAAAS